MEVQDWILVVIALLLCGVSCYLLVRDQEKMTKATIVYSVISTIIVVGITIALCLIYEENTFTFNLKRVSLLSILWAVAFIDYQEYRIPNSYIILGLVYRVLIILPELLFEEEFLRNIIAEGIAAVALLLATGLCKLMIKNAIGAGDMKLFIVMGLLLGLDGIWSAVFMSLIVSFFIAVFLLVTKKKSRSDNIPFGPAITLGTYLSIFLTGM